MGIRNSIVQVMSVLAAALVFAGCIAGAQAQDRVLTATHTAAAATDKKVALVIGNATYADGALRNPVNDARAVSAKLQKLGFDVVRHENVTARNYGAVLRDFRNRLAPGAVALFFYAGHGLQVNGKNYFPAVDAQIVGEDDIPMQSLELNQVLGLMEQSKTRMNLVFLDACRNNPYTRSFRSAAGGLARVEAPSGTLISYATRPGSVAADGAGANGLYTSVLLKNLETPGLPVELLLKRVVGGVADASRGAQEPWMEGSIRGDFYFVPGSGGNSSAVVSTPEPVYTPPPVANEKQRPVSVAAPAPPNCEVLESKIQAKCASGAGDRGAGGCRAGILSALQQKYPQMLAGCPELAAPAGN